MNRRDFLKGAAASAALASCFPASLAGVERELEPGKIERRSLGRTGLKFSTIGFGGFALNGVSAETARELVREACEGGVNYFDIAPSYGNAQQMMGPALEPYRDRVYLACKTGKRDKTGATAELDKSLKDLRTDHFDVYQLHAVTTTKDVESIFATEGAIHAFEEAKKQGKVRLLGFSAHSVEAAMALMNRYDFDTIMFPVNYATWHAGNFGPQVLDLAYKKKMGIFGLKAMALRPWPKDADRRAYPNCWYEPMTDPEEALMGLRFTLSHPVTAALTPADPKSIRLALKIAPRFQQLSDQEVATMKAKAQQETPLFRYPQQERADVSPYWRIPQIRTA
jgi:predicted aldo/keto reductase-like oxidoreductase